MAETKSSSRDSKSSQPPGAARWRLAAVIGIALGAAALVTWLGSVTWRRVTQLEAEFSAVRSERYLLGLHARESVARMNAALLHFQLSGETNAQNAFLQIDRDLTNRLSRAMPELPTAEEKSLAESLWLARAVYRAETAELIEKRAKPVRKDTAGQIHDLIQEKSRDLERWSGELARVQEVTSAAFLQQAAGNLASLRRIALASVCALIAFAVALAAMAYATFVAPLRAMLTQSRAVIERHEKLASLGTLAAGVAHEIRNPLQALKMRLFSLRKSLPPGFKDAEDLLVISSEINRLEKIVKDTLQFARPGDPEMTNIAAGDLVASVAELLGASLKKRGVELAIDCADQLFVRVDRQQMQQVLINLVLNAAESIEGEGRVVIRAAPEARAGAAAGEGQSAARIEVIDTGRGIDPEIGARIFDPFFSTREGGAGLGLAIAARIVEKHGGFIQYTSRRGHGTTFSVVLPGHRP